MTEWIRAAQYGDPWACDQVLGAHRPLLHALVSRALDTRPAGAVEAVVRDTLRRAHGSLHTLPYPEAFRPWLLALAVDTTLAHAAAGPDGTGGWLDTQDAVLASLGALEGEGWLLRHETTAALQWTPEETALRMETVRARVEAARSVGAALGRRPRCPGLQELTAGWDGRPGAGWRDHLAAHTSRCDACRGVAPAPVAAAPVPGPSAAEEWPTVGTDDVTHAYDLAYELGAPPRPPPRRAAPGAATADAGARRRSGPGDGPPSRPASRSSR
ncbi:RNA polymerase sigma factor [Streptomyces sp. KL110A]|uniref:RNA polymerase sigma factor n=1 Tax=Streptomyces sp. KL110A TaxID=3384221 RepID=UPI0038C6C1EA